jgi:hypothetical protein
MKKIMESSVPAICCFLHPLGLYDLFDSLSKTKNFFPQGGTGFFAIAPLSSATFGFLENKPIFLNFRIDV